MRRRSRQVRIGISGWRYAPWRGTFYPRGLAQHRELEFASRAVNTVEINGSFYSLQTPSSYRGWHAATPDGFVFAVKGGRFITHNKRLRDVRVPLANFFASGVLALAEKLGPFLWQLPPNFSFDAERLAAFFDLLPRTRAAAVELAREHDGRLRTKPWLERGPDQPLRHALEVRHASFQQPEFVALLRAHHIGLVVADTAGKWPFMEDVTADFVYVRLHGDKELYASGYAPRVLAKWAQKIEAWRAGEHPAEARVHATPGPRARAGRDVYVYFDNDVKVRAPFDAMSLAHRFGLGPKPGRAPDPGTISETPRTRWHEFGRARAPVLIHSRRARKAVR